MVIDSHVHIFPEKIAVHAAQSIGEFYGISMNHPGSVPALLAAMERGSVSRALVCSVALSPARAATINDFIHSQVLAYPDRLIGLAALHPDMEHPEDELRRALDMGLKGVKIHSDMQGIALSDPRMDKLYAICEGVCPMLLHMGDKRYHYDNPSQIPAILRKFPRLQLICAHMGGYSEWEEAQEYLTDENVFVDCSSSFFALKAEGMRQSIACFGTERVLFGSDFPMWDPGAELTAIRSLNLPETDMEKILHLNVERLLEL